MGKLVTISETAKRLGLTEQTIRNWIKDGHISVKEVGKARYIDEDTIFALQDTAEDIARQKAAIESIRGKMLQEKESLRLKMDDNLMTRRYKKIIIGQGLQTGFFRSILRLYNFCGILNEREAVLFDNFLKGHTLEEVGDMFGLTRERVRQILEKVVLKSEKVTKIEQRLREVEDMAKEIVMLKKANESLKEFLSEYETHETPSEERINEMDALCKLLSTPLIDCNLSVRALNCLRAGRTERRFSFEEKTVTKVIVLPCETIGDLCKLTKEQFLMIRNAGKKTLRELDDFLEERGLCWGMDVDKIYRENNLTKMYL